MLLRGLIRLLLLSACCCFFALLLLSPSVQQLMVSATVTVTCAHLDSTIVQVTGITTHGHCATTALHGRPSTCALPGETFTISVQMTNTGTAAWDKSTVMLNLTVDGQASTAATFGANIGSLKLASNIQPGEHVTFTGTMTAPGRPGRYVFSYQLVSSLTPVCASFGDPAQAVVEVTCSDGIFCNGVERYVNGHCVAAAVLPCDDSQDCTQDNCLEDIQHCQHIRILSVLESSGYDCSEDAVCYGSEEECTPVCTHQVDPECEGDACEMVDNECGGDGCGATCGQNNGLCADLELSCNQDGMCEENEAEGSCAHPYELPIGGSNPDVQELSETFTLISLDVDTSIESAQFVAAATCNPSATSGQVMAHFSTPSMGPAEGWYLDARVGSDDTELDTILELRQDTCYDPVDKSTMVSFCNDDASPPGGVGSRIEGKVYPNHEYYLIVGGYNSETVGPATLTLKFSPNAPQCLSRFCGADSKNPGNVCGECADGMECDEFFHCRLARDGEYCTAPLATRCSDLGRLCGSDGCGNSCGSCDDGELCTPLDGICRTFPVCDHMHPTCDGCTSTQYCGSDCTCRAVDAPLPDIYIDQTAMASSVLYDEVEFDEYSCSFVEQCVSGSGVRKLLRFDTTTVNQGRAHLTLENPATRPDLFMFGACHNHYHYEGYASYQLVATDGTVAATGHKQGYCMQDSTRYETLSGLSSPCRPETDCENPGISMGWSDTYGNSLDCQWVDITDVELGDYVLEVELNSERRIPEATTENNIGTVRVRISEGGAEVIPDTNGATQISPCGWMIMAVIALVSMLFGQ